MRARRIVVDSEHSISLGRESLPYRLKRSNQRRTIGLKVDSHGLIVAVPLETSLSQVEKILKTHTDWILEKTQEWRVRQEDVPNFIPGSQAWWLGRQVPIIPVEPHRAIPRVLSEDEALTLSGIPVAAEVKNPRAALTAWYQVQALPWFSRRGQFFAQELPKKPARLLLSDAQNRWGSCTHQGIIRLNWRLIQASPEEIDYVVAHEFAHLIHMNHGPDFWATVERLYPDWKRVSKTLNARDRLYRQI